MTHTWPAGHGVSVQSVALPPVALLPPIPPLPDPKEQTPVLGSQVSPVAHVVIEQGPSAFVHAAAAAEYEVASLQHAALGAAAQSIALWQDVGSLLEPTQAAPP